MQVCKPGSVSSEVLPPNISIIYLCDLPISVSRQVGIERDALKPRPIWPFNIRGLPYANITACTRRLLPHVFTITASLSPRLLGFCGTLCYNTFRPLYPRFHTADLPALPGLSSAKLNLAAIEQPAFKFTDFSLIENNNL